ncbi:hypothetical protein ES703_119971 [subsurface metagenome]
MNEQKVERLSFTRRYLDRMKNPPEYVDEELPTKTVKIFKRGYANGTMIDGLSGTLSVGSIEFSGSHYDFGPGSFSLRIMRRSVYVGSVMVGRNLELEWAMHHSREGTIDVIPFFLGTQVPNLRGIPIGAEVLGGPMNPIYSLGPGTINTFFSSRRGSARVYSSLEGIIG